MTSVRGYDSNLCDGNCPLTHLRTVTVLSSCCSGFAASRGVCGSEVTAVVGVASLLGGKTVKGYEDGQTRKGMYISSKLLRPMSSKSSSRRSSGSPGGIILSAMSDECLRLGGVYTRRCLGLGRRADGMATALVYIDSGESPSVRGIRYTWPKLSGYPSSGIESSRRLEREMEGKSELGTRVQVTGPLWAVPQLFTRPRNSGLGGRDDDYASVLDAQRFGRTTPHSEG
jgi:hypothetical protein